MSATRRCPDRSRLQGLLAGQLLVAEHAEIARHVETCVGCQQVLEGLTPASQSWEDVAAHLKRERHEPAPALQQVIERAKATTGTQPTEAGGKDSVPDRALVDQTLAEGGVVRSEDLAYLAPPTRANGLGRLGHYEIVAVLGSGGFGTVLKAFDDKLHRMVAIKVLAPELAANGSARQRFIREARAAAAVTHEHLVTIYAVEEEQRPPYLVMQLIDGMTLQQKLEHVGTLGLREILRIGMQMAEGLAAAHKQGLVHRDIKPANVLLENGVERVKITDFGLARSVQDVSMTQSGVVTGTPLYMSPEQASGLLVDHRSDLFSLGTVLYVMCTGRQPFRASGPLAVLKRVIEDTPRPIGEINPEVPVWLVDIIARLHAKNPAERVQSAREVADLLGFHLAQVQQPQHISLPSAAAPVAARAAPWLKVIGMTVLVLCVLGGLYIAGWGTRAGYLVEEPNATLKKPAPPQAVAPFDVLGAQNHQAAWATYLGSSAEITNSIGMKLRLIPPGDFQMGSPPDQVARVKKELKQAKETSGRAMIEHETPAHPVRLTRPFYLGAHEVTVMQFRRFVEGSGYQTDAERDGKGGVFYDAAGADVQKVDITWRKPGPFAV